MTYRQAKPSAVMRSPAGPVESRRIRLSHSMSIGIFRWCKLCSHEASLLHLFLYESEPVRLKEAKPHFTQRRKRWHGMPELIERDVTGDGDRR